jgi:hypothetical protein
MRSDVLGKLIPLVVALTAGLILGAIAKSSNWSWEAPLLIGGIIVGILVAASVRFALGPLVGRHVHPDELAARFEEHGRPAPAGQHHRF